MILSLKLNSTAVINRVYEKIKLNTIPHFSKESRGEKYIKVIGSKYITEFKWADTNKPI
jgi:hypothetical protein